MVGDARRCQGVGDIVGELVSLAAVVVGRVGVAVAMVAVAVALGFVVGSGAALKWIYIVAVKV